MCDCLVIKEILDHDGPIAIICRWVQEFLGYHFSILHQLERMMIGVDVLSRRLGPIVAHNLCAPILFHKIGVDKRPLAYTRKLANTPANTKIIQSNDWSIIIVNILDECPRLTIY